MLLKYGIIFSVPHFSTPSSVFVWSANQNDCLLSLIVVNMSGKAPSEDLQTELKLPT